MKELTMRNGDVVARENVTREKACGHGEPHTPGDNRKNTYCSVCGEMVRFEFQREDA
jgi:hypothetical protein